MIFNPLPYFVLLGSVALSFSSFAQGEKPSIPVVTDETELRKITDTYRGSPKRENDFIPKGDGTVIDKRTGLQWMRCSLGQKWTGQTCEGEATGYKWEQSSKERSDFAGNGDWRLPTVWELETLVYCSSGEFEPRGVKYEGLNECKGDYQKPTMVKSAFPNTPKWSDYWSSSSDAGSNSDAWVVDFDSGYDNSYYKDLSSYVRLVRCGQ